MVVLRKVRETMLSAPKFPDALAFSPSSAMRPQSIWKASTCRKQQTTNNKTEQQTNTDEQRRRENASHKTPQLPSKARTTRKDDDQPLAITSKQNRTHHAPPQSLPPSKLSKWRGSRAWDCRLTPRHQARAHLARNLHCNCGTLKSPM